MTMIERLARFIHGTLLMDERHVLPIAGTFAETCETPGRRATASFEVNVDTRDPRLGAGRLRITVEVLD